MSPTDRFAFAGSQGNGAAANLSLDDGSTDASIFPAHGQSANAISWAPSVLSSPPEQPPQPGQAGNGPAGATLQTQNRLVSGGSDNLIRIWGYDEGTKKWVEEEVIRGHDDWVRDVAWAPNIGLPGMYIASASQVSDLVS